MKRAAAALAVSLLLVMAGCSGKPPVISRVFARVVYVHDVRTGGDAETLGVFLVASDPDGMENLSAFHVINDEADLFWKVDSGSWTSITAEGESWIGTNALTVPADEHLASGTYRVVLQSVSGDTVEDTFALPPRTETATEARYPTAAVADGQVKISGPGGAYEIWVYDRGGRFLASVPAPGSHPAVSLKALATASGVTEGASVRVYSWNGEGGYGVLAGPWPLSGAPSK
jgi:hypothetical protein